MNTDGRTPNFFSNYSSKSSKYLFWLPLTLSIVVFFFHLGIKAFLDYDEAAFAEVVRETLKAHQFASFVFMNVPWFHKPPLFFWLAMASVEMFPHVEFAMRLVPALSGVGLVMMTYALAKFETKNTYAATLAALIVLSTAGVVDLARQVKIDVPVTLAIVASYYCYVRCREEDWEKSNKSKKWLIGVGICVGIGVLLKSVIGLLVFPLILFHSFFSRDWRWWKNSYFWLGTVLSVVIIAPWHIYESFVYGKTFWDSYLFSQVVDRFTTNLFSTHLTIWQFIGQFFLNDLPWLFLFIALCIVMVIDLPQRFTEWKSGTLRPIEASLHAAVLYVFFIFIGFAVAGTRVIYYLAPAYPFVALSISYGMLIWWQRRKKTALISSIAAACSIIGLATSIVLGFHLIAYMSGEQHMAEDEKVIGLELRNISAGQTVYFFDPNYWETVRFYSNGKMLAQLDPKNPIKGSLVVVLDSEIGESFFKTEPYQTLYKGNYVSLVRI